MIENEKSDNKSVVWSFGLRIFHTLLVVSFVGAYISSDIDGLLALHAAFGVVVLSLLIFRIPYGFFGTKYARFKDFALQSKALIGYMKSVFSKKEHFTGHNPASSYATLGIIAIGILCAISGLVAIGEEEGVGIFGALYGEDRIFKEIHELLANLFIAIILAHIAGVMFEHFYHKSGVARAMINGKKSSSEGDIKSNIFQKVYFLLWIGFSIFAFVYTFNQNSLVLQDKKEIFYEHHSSFQLFKNECGSCHTLYPTYALNADSWEIMMDDLENHFGEDASLNDEDNQKIRTFLVANSAEKSENPLASKFLRNYKDGAQEISKSYYFKRVHRDIPGYVFESEEIKKASNCVACHENIDTKGTIDKIAIDRKFYSAVAGF